jgi:hypothetical protein
VTFAIHVGEGPSPAPLHVLPGDRSPPFPSADWTDYPVIVLAWWLADYEAVRTRRATVQSSFMNGPYALRVSPARIGDTLAIGFLRRTTTGDVDERPAVAVAAADYHRALTTAAAVAAASALAGDPDLAALHDALERAR